MRLERLAKTSPSIQKPRLAKNRSSVPDTYIRGPIERLTKVLHCKRFPRPARCAVLTLDLSVHGFTFAARRGSTLKPQRPLRGRKSAPGHPAKTSSAAARP